MVRKLGYSVLLLTIAAGAYLAGSWRAPRETVVAAERTSPRAILYYRCPMHPHVKSDRPGTTPCCGMAFEPVYADQAPAADTDAATRSPRAIAVSGAQQQLIGVKVGTVVEASGTETVRAFGRVTPEETHVHRLTAGLEGYVSEIAAVSTGSRVRKDQWLASFSTSEARVPIANFITAVNVLEREENNGNPMPASLAAARTSTVLAIDRLVTMGMSRVQIEEIRRTRLGTTTVRMTSPVDGFVLARNASAGQRFDAGAELFQVTDLQHVWILADVPIDYANDIRPGTLAQVRVGGRETGVRARVIGDVLPQFDTSTQSFKLRLEADNPGFVLRPDMFVDVDFQVPYPTARLVPVDAVVVSGLRRQVFVERSAGVFEPRDVETGRRHGDRIAVLKGLEPGERIVMSGTFLLDSESRMKTHDRTRH